MSETLIEPKIKNNLTNFNFHNAEKSQRSFAPENENTNVDSLSRLVKSATLRSSNNNFESTKSK